MRKATDFEPLKKLFKSVVAKIRRVVEKLMGIDSDRTEGESNFEKFLRSQKHKWKREVLFGLKKPDYLVQTYAGDVLCEVKDFDEGNFDRVILKSGLETLKPFIGDDPEVKRELQRLQGVEGKSAGAWDPFGRVQEKIATASKQLKPAKGKLPCMIVLFNRGFAPHERDLFMRLGIGKNRFFSAKHSTTVSALAVLDLEYPNKELLHEKLHEKSAEIRKKFPGADPTDRDMLIEVLETVGEYEEKLRSERPHGFFDKAVPKLRIYHNEYPVLPLPVQCFEGISVEHIFKSKLWGSDESPLVGQSVVRQTDDWTCNHCGSLHGVKIIFDTSLSQQWSCAVCQAKMDVEKLSGAQQHIKRGEHGPNRDVHNVGRGCCLPVGS